MIYVLIRRYRDGSEQCLYRGKRSICYDFLSIERAIIAQDDDGSTVFVRVERYESVVQGSGPGVRERSNGAGQPFV